MHLLSFVIRPFEGRLNDLTEFFGDQQPFGPVKKYVPRAL
ncbi:hypothetical protein B4092_2276 [Bacillus licheniformis]|nr:hypothetical protein N399_11985 [Bacillus licheniformis CG-B52]KYC68526.1 hypothetical protein B4092_2276 [Bacillus licheniformis]